jgi:hypothetical protein
MENAIWSRHFAREVARTLGYPPPEGSADLPGVEEYRAEADGILDEITEAFRYLHANGKIDQALTLARFLRAEDVPLPTGQRSWGWLPQKLREVRDYVLFLRQRYGEEHPADESDEWTDEDRRDCTLASMRRLEEEDPWPEDDSYPEKEPEDAHAGRRGAGELHRGDGHEAPAHGGDLDGPVPGDPARRDRC